MVLLSALFRLLLSVFFVSGHLLIDDRTTRRPRKGNPEKGRIFDRQQRSVGSQDDNECQEGNPLGASYSGRVNVTASGKTCQIWAASQPHEHSLTHVGEHNYCRNPVGAPGGVWCFTTDPDKPLELCSVPMCHPTYDCQEGDPLGVTYVGIMNTTASGRTCKAWAETSYWEFVVGEHNHCRNPIGTNPEGDSKGVWCFTTDPYKLWEHCSVPICLKVLDFSADNDHALDSNDEYTSASLDAGFLPESFTVCSAIMVDAWTDTEFAAARMFTLIRDEDDGVRRYQWGSINLRPGLEPLYEVNLGPARFIKKTTVAVFPLQWT